MIKFVGTALMAVVLGACGTPEPQTNTDSNTGTNSDTGTPPVSTNDSGELASDEFEFTPLRRARVAHVAVYTDYTTDGSENDVDCTIDYSGIDESEGYFGKYPLTGNVQDYFYVSFQLNPLSSCFVSGDYDEEGWPEEYTAVFAVTSSAMFVQRPDGTWERFGDVEWDGQTVYSHRLEEENTDEYSWYYAHVISLEK